MCVLPCRHSVSRKRSALAHLAFYCRCIFLSRTNRGVSLPEEGTKFLSYARQVVEQADLLEHAYKGGAPVRRVFAVSAQHYAFVVNAFVSLVRAYEKDEYEFSLRESRTGRSSRMCARGGASSACFT